MRPTTVLRQLALTASLFTGLLPPGGLSGEQPGTTPENVPPRRNIILFFVDDLGWTDIQGRNPKFATPHVDQLARAGVQFTQAYVPTPACSPSRAALLTGQHPARLRIIRHIPASPKHADFDEFARTETAWNRWPSDPGKVPSRNWLPLKHRTYAEALRDLGYQNHFVGKWHLGHEPYHPVHQGFDSQFGTTNLGHPDSYLPPFFKDSDVVDDAEGYLTDRLADETIRLIESSDDNQPFMISHWFYGVHKPHVGRPDLVARFRREGLEGNELHYAAMLAAMDEAVGRIRSALVQEGIAEHTAILFLSDQGSWFPNPPFRGSKRVDPLCEGSARIPLLVHIPGVTQPNTVNDSLVQTLDILPTLVDMAGGQIADLGRIDGQSIWPILQSGETLDRNAPLFGYRAYEDMYITVRQGPWKLFGSRGGQLELYHVATDRYEQHDVADEHADVVSELKAHLVSWERELQLNEYSGFAK